MVVTRKIDMDHYCSGIAYNKDKLFVSDEENAVYIHDMNGRMIRKITTDNSGKSIFRKSRHISVSTNRECVYVCDNDNGLVTLDMQGNHISTFTDDDMSSPHDVCTDGRGNIFVGAWTSSNITQIREDSMTKIGVIKTDQIPLSVCFDKNKNIIFVTHHEQNSIKVYTLE
jgi:sugar lactone lactonase YvrE